MKKLLSIITLLVLLVGSVFAESHNKKFERGAAICQQIAQDYNIEVEVKKVAALPNNAAACCMKKEEGKFVIKMNWNYCCSMTDNVEVEYPCSAKDKSFCLSFPDRCEGTCKKLINISKLCGADPASTIFVKNKELLTHEEAAAISSALAEYMKEPRG